MEGEMAVMPRLPADPPVKKLVSCITLSTAFSSMDVRAGAMLLMVGMPPGKMMGSGRFWMPNRLITTRSCTALS